MALVPGLFPLSQHLHRTLHHGTCLSRPCLYPDPELFLLIPRHGLGGCLGTEGSLRPDTPVPMREMPPPDMSRLSVHPHSRQHPLAKGKAAARGQSTGLGGAWSICAADVMPFVVMFPAQRQAPFPKVVYLLSVKSHTHRVNMV